MAKPLAKILALLTPKRRWAQFSLATMFVVVTMLCVGLRLVVAPAERQRRAVAAIKSLGGLVGYEVPDLGVLEAFPRPILRRWLPQDYFDEVQQVDLGTPTTDLQGLPGLEKLFLGKTQVTDAGLAQLHGLTEMERLWLSRSQVTDAGLEHLQGLTGLRRLHLNGTQVTDAGLEHLQGLTGLKLLNLRGTQVTDAGLAHLHGMTGLQSLDLRGTHVTDAGLEQFWQALPNCAIVRP